VSVQCWFGVDAPFGCVVQEEITESLNQCSSRITDLKEEMKEYTESADRIRDDIKALRNR